MLYDKKIVDSVLIKFPNFHGDKLKGVVMQVLYLGGGRGVISSSRVVPQRISFKGTLPTIVVII